MKVMIFFFIIIVIAIVIVVAGVGVDDDNDDDDAFFIIIIIAIVIVAAAVVVDDGFFIIIIIIIFTVVDISYCLSSGVAIIIFLILLHFLFQCRRCIIIITRANRPFYGFDVSSLATKTRLMPLLEHHRHHFHHRRYVCDLTTPSLWTSSSSLSSLS